MDDCEELPEAIQKATIQIECETLQTQTQIVKDVLQKYSMCCKNISKRENSPSYPLCGGLKLMADKFRTPSPITSCRSFNLPLPTQANRFQYFRERTPGHLKSLETLCGQYLTF